MKTCSPSEQGSVESEVAILDEIQSGVSAATTSALAGESLDDNDATGNRNIDVTIESDEVFDSSNSSAINGHLNLNLNCPPKEGQKLDNEEITPFANSAANSEFSNSEFEKLESSGLLESSSEHVFCDTENDDSLENSSSTTIVSKSCQTCSIDLLENSIEDAKSNKKNLFAAMETVINMMKEAELQEEKAELSEKEALLGGLDTLERVEDLRQMLQLAREANDMVASNGYGFVVFCTRATTEEVLQTYIADALACALEALAFGSTATCGKSAFWFWVIAAVPFYDATWDNHYCIFLLL